MNENEVSPLRSTQSSLGGRAMGWGWVRKGSGRLGVGIGSQRAAMRAFRGWEGSGLGGSEGSSGIQLQIMGVV